MTPARTPGADVSPAVRDAFDVPAAHAWLAAHIDDLPPAVPQISQFTGGASNLTYLLRYPDRELVLRRPPVGTKASSAHDMGREYRLQAALKPVYPYVPTVRAHCADPQVIGGEFYVMDRVPGTILRGNLPPGLSLDRAQARGLSETFVDTLVDLHRVDVGAAGLTDLGRGDGYVARQVAGWTERYARARTPNVPRFTGVSRWLAQRRPEDTATCLIHNDFRLDNLVLGRGDPLRVVGVLDWEMATLGDPLMDLGGALAYWVQADDDPIGRVTRRQPSHLPGMLTRAQIVERYAERTGRAVDDWAFYEVFGLFRLAVIAQQIYFRYHHRQSRNPAFRHYWVVVSYLNWRCRRLIRQAGALIGMPVIHLVRHGQASFGGDDYDVLSPTGRQQATILGAALAARCPTPATITCGTLSRQRETAALAAAAAGWTGAAGPDGRWNEYDHLDILAAHAARAGAASPAIAEGVQHILDAALTGWIDDGTTGGYAETWPSFTGRVRTALGDVIGGLDRGGAAVVFTSAGVIAAICADLLAMPPAGFLAVNRVQANASVTTVVHGRSGTSLLTFNEHSHLTGSTVPVTYR